MASKQKQPIFGGAEPPRNFPINKPPSQNIGGRSAAVMMQIKKTELDLISKIKKNY